VALGLAIAGLGPGGSAALAQETQPSTSVAVAAPSEDARALFQRGQSAYSQGDYESAASLWEQAYGLDPRVGLQFNLSQCYERLGRLEEAARALQTYVDGTDPEDERLPDARARLLAIRERIARTSVRLEGGPDGAVLVVDGEDRGRLPRPDPLMLAPGSHEIRVTSPGYVPFTTTVSVPAGQVVDVGIVMTRVPTSGGEPGIASLALLGGGAAVLATGLIIGGVALNDAGNVPSPTSSEASNARTLAIVSDVLWPIGSAAIVGGLVWLIVDVTTPITASGDRTAFQLVPLVGPGIGGAVGSVRF
jgi:hypothetical protein